MDEKQDKTAIADGLPGSRVPPNETSSSPKLIAALPPWHPSRTYIRLVEVPFYIKRLFNINVSPRTVMKWVHEGRKSSIYRDKRIYLRATRMIGRYITCTRADLVAFMEAEGNG